MGPFLVPFPNFLGRKHFFPENLALTHPCRSILLVNEEFHPPKSGYFNYVIAVIYMCTSLQLFINVTLSKINLRFIRIQTNKNNYKLFNRITLSFVYFWQVIFFWVVMLHIMKSNVETISQIKVSQRLDKTLELQILCEEE